MPASESLPWTKECLAGLGPLGYYYQRIPSADRPVRSHARRLRRYFSHPSANAGGSNQVKWWRRFSGKRSQTSLGRSSRG